MCQCYILTEEKVVGYWCWNGNKPQKNKISVDRSVQGVKKASTNRTTHLVELRPHEIIHSIFFSILQSMKLILQFVSTIDSKLISLSNTRVFLG